IPEVKKTWIPAFAGMTAWCAVTQIVSNHLYRAQFPKYISLFNRRSNNICRTTCAIGSSENTFLYFVANIPVHGWYSKIISRKKCTKITNSVKSCEQTGADA
ncbi:hypothetical protein LLG96_05905, partial [bacterium]|nr:hypothetical protein [bacterium]